VAAGRTKAGVLLRILIFAFLEIAGLAFFPPLLLPIGGYFIAAALGTFSAAAVANAIVLRIYERGNLSDIGLGWGPPSVRHLAYGVAGGIGAALLAVLPPLLAGVSELKPDANAASGLGAMFFVSLVLLFAAVGEEMLFRGYGFQVLMNYLGPFATILPVGVIFGLAHGANLNFSLLGFINTTAWGILLGYAFLRSGDLWLAIGLHFGWNWTFPFFGVKLSGFTMGVTGYAMHWNIGELWSGGEYGPEASLLTLPIVALLFLYLHKAPIERQPAYLVPSLQED
jgi:Predicted metal-dependent membrane protease